MGLLGSGQDPVLAGLLSMGPEQIRALKQQQMAQQGRAPALIGASAPQAQPNNIGQGMAGIGQGIAAIGQGIQAGRQREAENAAIQQYVGGIQDPAQRERVMAMAATPDGRQFLMQGLAKQAFPEAQKPVALGEGEILVNPADGRQVAAGPPKPVDANKMLIPDPDNPGKWKINQQYLDARSQLAAAGAPSVTVNNSPDKKYGEENAKQMAKAEQEFYNETLSRGSLAAGSLFNYEMMLDLLNKGDISGGNFVLGAVETMRSVGIPDSIINRVAGEGAVDLTTFNGILAREVLQKQLAQKGPQTESDAKRLQASVANINAPAQANQILLRSARATAALDQAQKDFAISYRRGRDYDIRGVREKMDETFGNMPFYVEKTERLADGSTARRFIFWDEFTNRYQEKNNVDRPAAMDAWKSYVTDVRRGK